MTTHNGHYQGISDLDLQALIDGELDEDNRRRIMNIVLQSAPLMKRLDALLQQRTLVRLWSQDQARDH